MIRKKEEEKTEKILSIIRPDLIYKNNICNKFYIIFK